MKAFEIRFGFKSRPITKEANTYLQILLNIIFLFRKIGLAMYEVAYQEWGEGLGGGK